MINKLFLFLIMEIQKYILVYKPYKQSIIAINSLGSGLQVRDLLNTYLYYITFWAGLKI